MRADEVGRDKRRGDGQMAVETLESGEGALRCEFPCAVWMCRVSSFPCVVVGWVVRYLDGWMVLSESACV